MAIMGFLVHSLKDKIQHVEEAVNAMPEMTTYGIHQEQYLVTVAEAPSKVIEKTVKKIEDVDGVLSLYTTYLTIEDEIDEDGTIHAEIDVAAVMGKKKKTRSEL